MRILFCGGGTAGHIYPAIAIAEEIINSSASEEIMFVGRRDGAENSPIIENEWNFKSIEVLGLKRRFSFSNIRVLYKSFCAYKESKRILTDYSPDAVIGTGGYVSLPVLYAALHRKIPIFIHESNAYPGLVTRLLAPKCRRVLLGFDGASNYISKKAIVTVTGNPVRKDFCTLDKAKAKRMLGISPSKKLCVSFGGSLGAEKINETMAAHLINNQTNGNTVYIHATGRSNYEKYSKYADQTGKGVVRLVPYIDNMPLILSAADLAITRSGAITLAELAASKTPAILVPSPNVAEDHQRKNAEAYAKGGAALIIEEDDFTPEKMREALFSLLCNEQRIRSMGRAAAQLYNQSTAKRIVEIIKGDIL